MDGTLLTGSSYWVSQQAPAIGRTKTSVPMYSIRRIYGDHGLCINPKTKSS